MEFLELAKKRFSVRDYEDKQIEKEVLDKIIEAGYIAPTAKNNQCARVYVIQSEEGLAKIRSLSRCAKEEGVSSGQQDASIVACHMMLEAADLGVGSVWVDVFPNTLTAKEFNLPESVKPVCLMPMGYAKEGVVPSPMHTDLRPINEMVKYL